MPPHGGGGHHGGGHHHHGGGGGGGGFYGPGWGWGGPGWWDYPGSTNVVVIDPSDGAKEQADKLKQRAMATIMALPKNQRAAAYRRMFAQDPPAGALGDFASMLKEPWLYIGAAVGLGAMYVLFKKSSKKGRRR